MSHRFANESESSTHLKVVHSSPLPFPEIERQPGWRSCGLSAWSRACGLRLLHQVKLNWWCGLISWDLHNQFCLVRSAEVAANPNQPAKGENKCAAGKRTQVFDASWRYQLSAQRGRRSSAFSGLVPERLKKNRAPGPQNWSC